MLNIMDQIKYTVDDNPKLDDDAVVRNGIVNFNKSVINEKASHFSVFAKFNERIIGGALIWEHSDALYIDVLWCDDDFRHQGVGTKIMSLIEDEANKKSIKKLFVETYGFQAKDFYKKQGFSVIGVIPQYILGHDKIFLRKDI